jgi:hypothetical protein|nr:MAG TPA: hypothetical protein [Caudoviricetes sp.]
MKINGTDIQTLHAKLVEGSLASLLSYPALKSLNKNDWAEESGTEYDLSAPQLSAKEITIQLLLPESQYPNLVTLLSARTYANYAFDFINLTYRLRLVGLSKTQVVGGYVTADIRLSDDFPLQGYIYQAPTLTAHNVETYIDGKNLILYGITLLEGTQQELITAGNVKTPYTAQNSTMSGLIADDVPIYFQERTATLKCFMYLPITDFIKGYFALLYDLVGPGERTLSYQGKSYKCIYKDGKITELYIDDPLIWIKFDLQLTII